MSKLSRNMPSKKAVGGIGALAAAMSVIVAMAVPGTTESEGVKTEAYYDPIGIPTVCVGETLNVSMGDSYTREECDEMLMIRLAGFLEDMRACTTVELPAGTETALLEFTYNLGSGVYCKNIARKRLNKGKYREACDALKLYVNAGGKPFRGLILRREREAERCHAGLDAAGME